MKQSKISTFSRFGFQTILRLSGGIQGLRLRHSYLSGCFLCCQQVVVYVVNRLFSMLSTGSCLCCQQVVFYVVNRLFSMLSTGCFLCCQQVVFYVVKGSLSMLSRVPCLCSHLHQPDPAPPNPPPNILKEKIPYIV